MNLGLENLRELLTSFLKSTGGRRGRQRERQRSEMTEPGASSTAAGTENATETAGETSSPDPDGTTGGDGDTVTGTGGGLEQDRPDPDDLDDDEVVDDLYHRLESLEDEFDQSNAQLGTIQDSQKEVADRVEDVNDRVRELVGIYDRLTDDVNPFTGEGEEREGFGVFDDSENSDSDDSESRFGLFDEDSRSSEETVSFEDLKTVLEDAATEFEESDAQKIPFADDADEADHENTTETTTEDAFMGTIDSEDGSKRTDDGDMHVDVHPTDSVRAGDETQSDPSDVTLSSIPETYAADVVIFEWLTELVQTAGPAATLRAISYYSEIGWIDESVKVHLESVLSGPDLDMHVEPDRTPEELTAEDHADSYEYIMVLMEIHDTKQEIES